MGWWKESIDIVKKNDPAAPDKFGGSFNLSWSQSLGRSSYLTFSLAPQLSTLSSYA